MDYQGLENEDIELRRAAVLSVRKSGRDRAKCISILLTGLADQSWRVRKTAQEILLEEYSPEEYMDGLINLLYIEDNAGARNAAIETLTSLNRRATDYLIAAFKTENNDVRKFIIDILGEFRDRRTLPVMLGALQDEDENVRASAVEHLGKLAEPSVVDALIEILKSGDLWTAYPAADALGRIGDMRAVPALIGALSRKALKEPVLKALSRLGDKTVLKDMVPLLRDPSGKVQEETLKAIEKLYNRGVSEDDIAGAIKDSFGESSIEVLLEHARDGRAEIRAAAIMVLGLLRDERALSNLLQISLEEDFSAEAGRALAFISRNKPESLLPLFKTDNTYIRRFLTRVAGTVSAPIYFDCLSELLRDDDGHVRTLAALGLANIGDLAAVPLIEPLLSDPYHDVQEAAVNALGKLEKGLDRKKLLKNLDLRNRVLRKNTARLLGKITKDEDVVAGLGFALKDDSPEVRKAVVEGLAEIGTTQAMKHLLIALTDENQDIRASAAINLGQLGGPGIFEHLSLLLSDSEDMVRAAAIRAMGMLGKEESVPFFIDFLKDPNGFVVTTAIHALGKTKGSRAEAAIVRMLDSNDLEIVRTAIKALSGFPNTSSYLIPFLKHTDWATRMAAVEAVGAQSGSREELKSMLDTEEDPVVRKTIERFLD